MPHWNSFDAFLEEAQQASDDAERQLLVDALLAERPEWPWVEENRATFVYSRMGTQTAALNLDTIQADPPFAPMTHLGNTTLWYVTQEFESDTLLDYMLAIDDPMTPLANEPDVVGRVTRFWRVDPLNPLRMDTAQMNVSVLRMPHARPFPDWSAMKNVPHGRVYEHSVESTQLAFSGRRLWMYTPPGYDNSGMAYPLLIVNDGQWAIGPLQLPYIADTLIKHGRMQPALIAMMQSGGQEERTREYVSNDKHVAFLTSELLPYIQSQYRVDSQSVGVGGVAMGAVAAAHAALNNPAVFSRLLMISPPFGKGPLQDQLMPYVGRFEGANLLPQRIFQSVGRYEARGRFLRPALQLHEVMHVKPGIDYQFVETGSGHGLVAFRSVLPEALSWVLPGG